MFIRIRKVDGSTDEFSVTVSNMNSVEVLKDKICRKLWELEGNSIKLFYRGKQLIEDHRVVDYNITTNDVIQLMTIDTKGLPSTSKTKPSQIVEELSQHQESPEPKLLQKDKSSSKQYDYQSGVSAESKYYKIGDFVDYLDTEHGCWFEGVVTKIIKAEQRPIGGSVPLLEPDILFVIRSDSEDDQETVLQRSFDYIQPRSRRLISSADLEPGQIVLVNYNPQNPNTRGYWYRLIVLRSSRKEITGTIMVGEDMTYFIENCWVKNVSEIFRIEEPLLLTEKPKCLKAPPRRKNTYLCEVCKDDKDKSCLQCGCRICRGKESWENIILCDECNGEYHTYCLTPPLQEVPSEDHWFCPDCKTNPMEIVQAGEKLKSRSKRSVLFRNGGRGMACIGHSSKCTLVPRDHYGPIPGIDVGTCWKFRLQVSEAGVHRPTVAGIHGRESHGAYSIVLSGGYEDDQDNGDEFWYTGSGGRDLRRKCSQCSDQTLIRMNKALALNCNAKLNTKIGAEAVDWKTGKPVRVVRYYKLREHSVYAPKEGYRYDGIYKVVKYYPEKGKSGFVIWRYLLRRDDPEPAPWTNEGVQSAVRKKNKKGRRLSLAESNSEPQPKVQKIPEFELTSTLKNLIKKDKDNQKLWKECLENKTQGFLQLVSLSFMCICCHEVVRNPITTECKHNICRRCLRRSFAADIYTCPSCRHVLESPHSLNVNENLCAILLALFPGYDTRRR